MSCYGSSVVVMRLVSMRRVAVIMRVAIIMRVTMRVAVVLCEVVGCRCCEIETQRGLWNLC